MHKLKVQLISSDRDPKTKQKYVKQVDENFKSQLEQEMGLPVKYAGFGEKKQTNEQTNK